MSYQIKIKFFDVTNCCHNLCHIWMQGYKWDTPGVSHISGHPLILRNASCNSPSPLWPWAENCYVQLFWPPCWWYLMFSQCLDKLLIMLFQISCQKWKKIVNCRPPKDRTLRTKDDTYQKLPLQPQDSSPQNATPKEAVKTTITTSVKKHHLVPWYEWTEASQQCRKKSWLSSQTLPNLTREFNIDFRELLHGTIAYRIVLEFQFIQECLTVYVHSSFPPTWQTIK